MTKNISILSNQIKTFKFYDIFDNNELYYCNVTINIKELKYSNGIIHYDISYLYTYSDNLEQSKQCNPFYYSSDIYNSNDMYGVIIIKNEMTTIMVEYLMMDFDELQKYCGSTWSMQYKIYIMTMLTLL